MRNLNSDGRSKNRNGCRLIAGSSSSISSSGDGDGGRSGVVVGGGFGVGDAVVADDLALEAVVLDLRVLAIM